MIERRIPLLSILLATALAASSLGTATAADAERSARPAAECANTVFDAMSLEERVGQLILLGIGAGMAPNKRKIITNRHIGSVTFSALVPKGTAGVKTIADKVQGLATTVGSNQVGLFIAANQEGGQVQALSGPGFAKMPPALTQGGLALANLRQRARNWGNQLVKAGVNLNLAPVGDVVPVAWVSVNQPIGQLRREFGHKPAPVANHVKAFINGMHAAQVQTTVKHFPGLGRVRGNTDFASGVRDTVTTRHDALLRPYQAAINVGVPFVMMSLASYSRLDGKTPAAFSRFITTTMLRGDLGFTGVIVSDDLSAVAVRSIPAGNRAIRSIRAGGNMITVTRLPDARAMITALVAQAGKQAPFKSKIDQSALLVLEAKESAGLLTCTS